MNDFNEEQVFSKESHEDIYIKARNIYKANIRQFQEILKNHVSLQDINQENWKLFGVINETAEEEDLSSKLIAIGKRKAPEPSQNSQSQNEETKKSSVIEPSQIQESTKQEYEPSPLYREKTENLKEHDQAKNKSFKKNEDEDDQN